MSYKSTVCLEKIGLGARSSHSLFFCSISRRENTLELLENNEQTLYTYLRRFQTMVEEVITTGVDALLDLLRGTDKIALGDAATQLHIPVETLQSWVDFLVEERIVGIEYTFTKPFIYLNRDQPKQQKKASPVPKLKEVKRAYEARARKKKIPAEQIPQLWEGHVQQELAYLEPFFTEQAQRRGVQDTRQRRELWSAYTKKLMERLQEV